MEKKQSTIYEGQSNKIDQRIINEIKNLKSHPSPLFDAHALPSDMRVWHFTLKGYPQSVYEGGLYHGVIRLPKEYPLKPPDIQFLTPNGRFNTHQNICLSASGFHPESWSPLWKVRNLVESIGAFMLAEDNHVGYINSSVSRRRELAQSSKVYECKECGFLRKEGDKTKPI